MFQEPGDTGFGGGGGGGGPTTPPGYIFPIAAKNINVRVKSYGTVPSFVVTWQDEEVIPPSQATVANWYILFCDEKTAGTRTGEADWPTKVLELSRILNIITSAGRGGTLSYTHTEVNMKDGFLTIIGWRDFNFGPPSSPWLVRLESSARVVSDDPVDPAVTLSVETYKGADYFNFAPAFTSPDDSSLFKGVQIYWVPYTTASYAAMGNMDVFVGTKGGYRQVSPSRRYPLDQIPGLGSGTVSTVSGDQTVTLVTGPTFNGALWNGRQIFIQWPGSTGVWGTRTVSSVTDTTHLEINTNAPATGTFKFFALALLHIYFVALSNFGTHRPDISFAPQVTL